MFQALFSPFRLLTKALGIIVFVSGVFTASAQETASSRPVLDFDGNKVFSKQELLEIANTCLDRYADTHPYETAQLDYCLHLVVNRMKERGYLQATLGKTLYEQKEDVLQATVPVEEGALYRIGEIKIENTKVLSPAQIQAIIGLNPGDVGDGEKLGAGLFERVKEAYGTLGYIQYTADVTPTFHLKEGTAEGLVDLLIQVDEGAQFKVRSIKFAGGDSQTNDLLWRELMVRDGEVYNSDLFSKSITRINNTGLYDTIDFERDVEFQTNEKAGLLDLTIRLKKKVASAANP